MAKGLGDYGIAGTPNQCVPHPEGSNSYGSVPQMNNRGDIFPAGNIQLRVGDHYGPHRGFGIRHIWAEHEVEMRELGYECVHDVPKFVARVITRGTPIYCEFNDPRGNHNVAVVKSSIGTAILQRKRAGSGADPEWIYSVVSVFTKKSGRDIGR